MSWLGWWFVLTPFAGLVLGAAFFAAGIVLACHWADEIRED